MFSEYKALNPTVKAVRFDTPPKRMGVGDVYEYMGESFTCSGKMPCVGDYYVKGEGFMEKARFDKKYRKADA